MSTVVGIDPSLRATGLARITAGGSGAVLEVDTVATSGHLADPLSARAGRIEGVTAAVLTFALPCDLAVIEQPAYRARGGSVLDRHGLWWSIVAELLGHSVPVAAVEPTRLKVWATGRGDADKAGLSAAVTRWLARAMDSPGEADRGLQDSNQADAAALASMGAQHLGLLPALGRHRAVLDRVAWPGLEVPA
jgi:Holliday junction resolvasome RuvABC endonuclease subunit